VVTPAGFDRIWTPEFKELWSRAEIVRVRSFLSCWADRALEGGHVVLASEGCSKAGLRGEREPDGVTTPRYIATRHYQARGSRSHVAVPGGHGNAGGEVRGLERAEDAANPPGVHDEWQTVVGKGTERRGADLAEGHRAPSQPFARLHAGLQPPESGAPPSRRAPNCVSSGVGLETVPSRCRPLTRSCSSW